MLKLRSIWKRSNWYRHQVIMIVKWRRLSVQSSFYSFRLMMRIGRTTLSTSKKWLHPTSQSRIVLLSTHLWQNFCLIVKWNEFNHALTKSKLKVHIITIESTYQTQSFKTNTTTNYCEGSIIWASHTWIIVYRLVSMAQLAL